jgi:hypothetical protein
MDIDVTPVPLEYTELVFELGEFVLRLPNRTADAQRHFQAAQRE